MNVDTSLRSPFIVTVTYYMLLESNKIKLVILIAIITVIDRN